MNAALKTAWPLSLRLPHPFVLLLGMVGVAAVLTWLIPAGAYQRRTGRRAGREVFVAGTYARVGRAGRPQGRACSPYLAASSRARTCSSPSCFRRRRIRRWKRRAHSRGWWPRSWARQAATNRGHCHQCCLATLGALENIYEEIIALIPVLVVLSRGLGFGSVTALAMSLGAARGRLRVRPTNPFQTGSHYALRKLSPLTTP